MAVSIRFPATLMQTGSIPGANCIHLSFLFWFSHPYNSHIVKDLRLPRGCVLLIIGNCVHFSALTEPGGFVQ